MSDLAYRWNEEIKCPYCDYEFTDSWEYARTGTDTRNVDCESCGKEFFLEIQTELTYSTSKLEVWL